MASITDLALLSLRVYSTPGAITTNGDAERNRPAIPSGWTELEWHADEGDGFSYGVYQNGSEIALAYAGTNEGIDWVTNIAAGAGFGSTQLAKATLAYLQAQQQYGPNITFTGHSLGGGLASVMAVWFNRPAVVFDEEWNRGQIPIIMMQNQPSHPPHGPSPTFETPRLPAPRHPAR